MKNDNNKKILLLKNHIKSFHAAALMSAEKLTPQYVAEGDAWPIALSCQNIVFTYPHNNNSDYNMLYAYSANACFAIELRLKLVIFLETNEWAVVRKCGHNLVSLMERISPESKKIMRAAFDEEKKKTKEFYSEPQKKLKELSDIPKKLRSCLQLNLHQTVQFINGAFEKWRYHFEGNKGLTGIYAYHETATAIDQLISILEKSKHD